MNRTSSAVKDNQEDKLISTFLKDNVVLDNDQVVGTSLNKKDNVEDLTVAEVKDNVLKIVNGSEENTSGSVGTDTS